MTEAEWLTSADPLPMLRFLTGRTNERKLRLFACGCCREAWDDLFDVRSRQAVEIAEALADHRSPVRNRRRWSVRRQEAQRLAALASAEVAQVLSHDHPAAVAASWAQFAAEPHCALIVYLDPRFRHLDLSREAHLLRDLFGNPFRPVAFSPFWQISTVTTLARQMYESRDFSLMPILADALQDAGCENADVLAHCRDPGPHVRGCWVVDLVLGKD